MARNRRKDGDDEVSLASEDSAAEETTEAEAATEEVAAEEEPQPAVVEDAVEEATPEAPVVADDAPEAPVKTGPAAGIQPGQYIQRGNLRLRVLTVIGNSVRGVVANSGKIITIDL